MTPAEAIVARFFAAFIGGRLDELGALIADGCEDHNPAPLQPVGRDGIVFKAAAFHARFAGFTTVLAEVRQDRSGRVVAGWTTRFPDGVRTAWRGRFEVTGDQITGFEVDHVA